VLCCFRQDRWTQGSIFWFLIKEIPYNICSADMSHVYQFTPRHCARSTKTKIILTATDSKERAHMMLRRFCCSFFYAFQTLCYEAMHNHCVAGVACVGAWRLPACFLCSKQYENRSRSANWLSPIVRIFQFFPRQRSQSSSSPLTADVAWFEGLDGASGKW